MKTSVQGNRAPPYGQRHGWVPRSLDFGDGSVFPEVATYTTEHGEI